MNETDDEYGSLLRRVPADAIERRTDSVKPKGLRLRTSQLERALSFYDSSHALPADVLVGAPRLGWGVISIEATELVALGFSLSANPDTSDVLVGRAHIDAMPPDYDEDGQVPHDLLLKLAAAARWVIRPGGV